MECGRKAGLGGWGGAHSKTADEESRGAFTALEKHLIDKICALVVEVVFKQEYFLNQKVGNNLYFFLLFSAGKHLLEATEHKRKAVCTILPTTNGIIIISPCEMMGN